MENCIVTCTRIQLPRKQFLWFVRRTKTKRRPRRGFFPLNTMFRKDDQHENRRIYHSPDTKRTIVIATWPSRRFVCANIQWTSDRNELFPRAWWAASRSPSLKHTTNITDEMVGIVAESIIWPFERNVPSCVMRVLVLPSYRVIFLLWWIYSPRYRST